MISNGEICREIVTYLATQQNKQDDLDGIMLWVFEQMSESFQEAIVKNIGYLVTIGVLKEATDERMNRIYKLAKKSSVLTKYLQKLELPKPDKPEIPNLKSQPPKSLPKVQGFESLDND